MKSVEFRNTKSHLLQVDLCAWVKIEIFIETNHVCYIIGHCYYSFQALSKYIVLNAS